MNKTNVVIEPRSATARPVFPDLRTVGLEDVLPHERTDAGRQVSLVHRISKEGALRNPPIVARLNGSGKYLLLDGANRLSALRCLDVRHLVVQVEDYDNPNLILSHWNHVVRNVESRTLIDMIQSIPGVFTTEDRSVEKPGANEPHHLCSIAFEEGRTFHVFAGLTISERIRYLGRICDLYYHGLARIDRVSHTDLETLRKHHRDFGGLMIYRDFSKGEIREMAEAGQRLPSGLTRFLTPSRVFGLDVPLAFLTAEESREAKQRRLEENIQRRISENRVRYYEEPTFVLED